MDSTTLPRRRHRAHSVLLACALGACSLSFFWQALPSFVSRSSFGSSGSQSKRSVRHAEGGDFAKLLKTSSKKPKKDFLLSPDEYKMALDAEMMSQRKKYYIGGDIKPNNLLVPWRVVSEKQIDKDARRVLKKNGILDPDGGGDGSFVDEDITTFEAMQAKEDGVKASVYSGTVILTWKLSEPEGKVGFIVERKKTQESNFIEVSTYDGMKNLALRVREGATTVYEYEDDRPPEGNYVYRVLVRLTNGEIQVLDTQNVLVERKDDTSILTAAIFITLFFVFWFVAGSIMDPAPTYE